jgi:hypothetical protein
MTGIPDNFDEMRRKKISEKTIKPPDEKVREINKFMDQVKKEEKIKEFENLGLNLNFNLEKIESKLIPTPQLDLGKGGKVDKGKESFFQLFSKPIYQAKHDIECWVLHMRNTDVKSMVETFTKTAPNLGVKMIIKTREYSQANVQTIDKTVDIAMNEGANICCIVIPNSMKNSYKYIKKNSI